MANEQAPSNASKMVLIACFLPHGLYLDIMDKSGKNVVARQKLKGNAGFVLPNPKRKFKNPKLTGDTEGAALTPIPADHWEQWKTLHPNFPALVNGAIFAAKDNSSAVSQATEHQSEDFGFNKADPENYGVETFKEGDDVPN